MTTLTFILSELFPLDGFRCSITWKLLGIFWWYFIVLYNRSWWCAAYKNGNSLYHTFWVISSWSFQLQFRVPTVTLWNVIMILHSYVEQVMMMCHVQEWQLSLTYFLSYFPLKVSDAISCRLHNLKIVWNIIMILHSYVVQVMAVCCLQEWQLSFLYFLSYLPLMVEGTIPPDLKTIRNIFIRLYEVVTMCLVYKISHLLWSYTPPAPTPKKKKNKIFFLIWIVKIHLLEISKLDL